VGWLLASLHLERVDRLVALSVGHPNVFLEIRCRSTREIPGTCFSSNSAASLSNC
jgi:hypothetical protein